MRWLCMSTIVLLSPVWVIVLHKYVLMQPIAQALFSEAKQLKVSLQFWCIEVWSIEVDYLS